MESLLAGSVSLAHGIRVTLRGVMPSPPGNDGAASERTADVTARLAAAVHAGDAAKLGELYARTAPALFAWISGRWSRGLRSKFDAEDLLQECWVEALGRFTTFDPKKGTFRRWMIGVAHYVMLNRIRRLSRAEAHLKAFPAAIDPDSLSQIPADVSTVSRRVSRDEALAKFVAFIHDLEDADREILLHCGLEDLSAREAGEALGLSTAAVEKRWQRLRARIRENVDWEPLISG